MEASSGVGSSSNHLKRVAFIVNPLHIGPPGPHLKPFRTLRAARRSGRPNSPYPRTTWPGDIDLACIPHLEPLSHLLLKGKGKVLQCSSSKMGVKWLRGPYLHHVQDIDAVEALGTAGIPRRRAFSDRNKPWTRCIDMANLLSKA